MRPEYLVNGFINADDPLSKPKHPSKNVNHPFFPLETVDIVVRTMQAYYVYLDTYI